MNTLKDVYTSKIIPNLMKRFQYHSVMQVPKISKITLNMGLGESAYNKKNLNFAIDNLSLISGQKPIITKARKSIANFKLRKGHPIGCKVTLRRKNMWNFFHRLISIVIPRIRDFRGFSKKSFDGMGNYSLGVKEQIIFPEIDYDKVDCIRGMDITITTTASSDREGYALLSAFNFPFRDDTKEEKEEKYTYGKTINES